MHGCAHLLLQSWHCVKFTAQSYIYKLIYMTCYFIADSCHCRLYSYALIYKLIDRSHVLGCNNCPYKVKGMANLGCWRSLIFSITVSNSITHFHSQANPGILLLKVDNGRNWKVIVVTILLLWLRHQLTLFCHMLENGELGNRISQKCCHLWESFCLFGMEILY